MNREHRKCRWIKGEDGASAVEFALVLPLLTLLLFGLFEAGRAFYTYSVASASVRDAARFAARLPVGCAGFTNGTDETKVKKLARTGSVDGSTGLVKGWDLDTDVPVTVSCVANPSSGTPPTRPYMGRFANSNQVPVIRVEADVPFSPLFASLVGLNVLTIKVHNEQVWTE
jgi:Flp pilus assembly protein TadG